MSPPSMALVWPWPEWITWTILSLALVRGIEPTPLTFPVVAPSQRAVCTHQAPSTLSNEWFSWRMNTTCWIGDWNPELRAGVAGELATAAPATPTATTPITARRRARLPEVRRWRRGNADFKFKLPPSSVLTPVWSDETGAFPPTQDATNASTEQ